MGNGGDRKRRWVYILLCICDVNHVKKTKDRKRRWVYIHVLLCIHDVNHVKN